MFQGSFIIRFKSSTGQIRDLMLVLQRHLGAFYFFKFRGNPQKRKTILNDFVIWDGNSRNVSDIKMKAVFLNCNVVKFYMYIQELKLPIDVVK